MGASASLAALTSELLAPRAAPSWASLADFVAALEAHGASASTMDTAARAGGMADRLGFAFVGGYRAALVALVPEVGPRTCLAATEKDGAHPRAIRTTLAERDGAFVLDGEKTFTTLATVADTMLVVARTGEGADGRPTLRVARVPTTRQGVGIVERGPTPFAPEVPHARVTLTQVHVAPDELLAGDGYADFLKPFRTVEDLHVLGATVGYLLATVARLGPPAHGVASPLAMALASLVALATEDPRDPAVHVALAGVAPLLREAVTGLDGPWRAADAEGHARFQRDLPLLLVAESARAERLAVARRTLSSLPRR